MANNKKSRSTGAARKRGAMRNLKARKETLSDREARIVKAGYKVDKAT